VIKTTEFIQYKNKLALIEVEIFLFVAFECISTGSM